MNTHSWYLIERLTDLTRQHFRGDLHRFSHRAKWRGIVFDLLPWIAR